MFKSNDTLSIQRIFRFAFTSRLNFARKEIHIGLIHKYLYTMMIVNDNE